MKKKKIVLWGFLFISGLICLYSCQINSQGENTNPSSATITQETEPIVTAEPTYEETTAGETAAQHEEATDGETDVNLTMPGKTLTYDPAYTPSVQVWEVNGALNDTGVPLTIYHTSDIDLSWQDDSMYQPEKNEVSYQFGDVMFNGIYSHRTESPYYQDDELHYTMENPNVPGIEEISISPDTGRLVKYISASYKENEADGPILSEDECRAIAEKFMYRVLAVSGSYELVSTDFSYGNYLFTFYRYIGNMKTAERISVRIGQRGRLLSFNSDMLGGMDGISVPDYDEEEVMAAVEHKVSNIYRSVIEKYTCTYEIGDVLLTRLQDGKFYLKYLANIYMVINDEGDFFSDAASLLIDIN